MGLPVPGSPCSASHVHAPACAAAPSLCLQEAARPLRYGYDHVLAEKVLKMEEKVRCACLALWLFGLQLLWQCTRSLL